MDGDPRAIARMYERHAHFLQIQCNTLGRQLSLLHGDLSVLRKENAALRKENVLLKRRVAELTRASNNHPAPTKPPPFVKPAVPDRMRKKPGRRRGHQAALRPRPKKVDIHREISLPVDRDHKLCCPECRTALSDVKHHRRLVEDIIPAKVVTTCFHTHSGYCPCCRKRIESRAPDQPPAADLPHAQLGLEALATAAVMRVCYRLPLRQISQLFADLPGLKLCPGAISKQIVRLGHWLSGQYDRLQLVLRAAGVVHADETGWRVNGQNGYLWTLTNKNHTLYHVDPSRSGKVIAELLGEAFGGTLVSDFYAVYDQFDCRQQKCLTHLLRDLREAVQQRPELSGHTFFTRCKSLLQQMLRLKKRRSKPSAAHFDRQVKSLETQLGHLSRQTWNDADADRLAQRLRKYKDRLTTFLHDRHVDGTNNAAERALRPAVVMRKITGGSRSPASAHAWAVLASVMRTAQQQGRHVLETIKTLLRGAWSGDELALLVDTS
jgi:regulator of replication initiation timing/transposase-like protein